MSAKVSKARIASLGSEDSEEMAGPGVASRSRSRGFITLPLMGWAAIGAGIIILGLSIALKVQSSRLESEQAAHVATKAMYSAFVAETKKLGHEAEIKAKAELAKQKQVNQERTASYEKRLAYLNSVYSGLRDQRANPGGGPVPPIPNAPVCPDGTASRDQLLAVLRAADEQTLRLIELQEWIRNQAKDAKF